MYRNWKEICQIPNARFMQALALLDLESEFGQMVAKRLPEYFTEEEQVGPIPLSTLFALSRRAAQRHNGGSGETDCLVSYNDYWKREGVNIPIFSFSTVEENTFDDPMLPAEIESQIDALGRRAEVGDTFVWEGKSVVLLENNDDKRGHCFLMYFAPAELIAIDK